MDKQARIKQLEQELAELKAPKRDSRLDKFCAVDATLTDPLCEAGLIDYEVKMKAYGEPRQSGHDQDAVNAYQVFKAGLAHYMMHDFDPDMYEPDPVVQGVIARAAINMTDEEREALLKVFTFEKVWLCDDVGVRDISLQGNKLWYEACNAALRAIP